VQRALHFSIAFLGVWGFQGPEPWRPIHLLVLVPLLFACLSFGLTPFVATRDVEAPETSARKLYLAGILFAVFAVIAALAIAYVVA
jgi:hypothetical protein